MPLACAVPGVTNQVRLPECGQHLACYKQLTQSLQSLKLSPQGSLIPILQHVPCLSVGPRGRNWEWGWFATQSVIHLLSTEFHLIHIPSSGLAERAVVRFSVTDPQGSCLGEFAKPLKLLSS